MPQETPNIPRVRTFLVLEIALLVFSLLNIPVTNAATPAAYGLKEGDMISASGSADPDIYIVNDAGYKRLFLNPIIFSFYGQLTGGFSAVKSVSVTTRDAFPTSSLFKDCQIGSVNNNGNVYALEVTGEDTGTLRHVAMSGAAAVMQDPNFFNKVFCINNNEFIWYPKGADYTNLAQIPVYVRAGAIQGTPTPTPNPTNGLGSPSGGSSSGSSFSAPAITFITPVGGEVIPSGPSNYSVQWNLSGASQLNAPAYTIELLQNNVLLGWLLRTNQDTPVQYFSDPSFWNYSWSPGAYNTYAVGAPPTWATWAPPGTGFTLRATLFDGLNIIYTSTTAPFTIGPPTPAP